MLDPKLKESIESAVRKAGQPPELAQGLCAWLEAVSSGNEQLSDRDAINRRLEVLYDKTKTVNSEGGNA